MGRRSILRHPIAPLLSLAAAMALGCGPSDPGGPPSLDTGSDATWADGGACEAPKMACGAVCCAPHEGCYDGVCCAPSCEGKDCGPDGCGGSCGGCGSDERCDAAGRCVCEDAEDDAAFCARHQIACGYFAGPDRCGETRSAACPDTCEPGECNALTGRCCAGEPESELCDLAKARNAIECGAGMVEDRCDVQRPYDCGADACVNPPDCDEATGRCKVCEGESDTELCSARGKNCGSLVAMNRCDVAVGVRDCGFGVACAASQTCSLNVCSDPEAPPTNDTCEGVEPLVFFNNAIYFSYDSRRAQNDMQTACGGASGPDVVYSITIPFSVPSHLVVTLSGPAIVSLHRACGDDALACQAFYATSGQVELKNVPPGDYHLWFDSLDGQGVEREVALQAIPITPPANDTCAMADQLPIPTSPWRGALLGASNEAGTDACGLVGPDVYYKIVMPAYGGLSIEIASRTPGFVPKASLLADCAGAAVQCGKRIGVNQLAQNQVRWIRVFGENGGIGEFDLYINRVSPVDNDGCGTAMPLPNLDGTIARLVQTAAANDDIPGGCAANGIDVVYTFDVPPGEERDLVVQTSPSNVGLRLQESCGGPDLKMSDCSLWGTKTLEARGLQQGTYYLIFETYGASVDMNTHTLSGELRAPGPPPANDLCPAASAPAYTLQAIPANDFTDVRHDSTVDARNEVSAGCPSGDLSGADVFYRFMGEGYLNAYVESISAAFSPNLFLLDACGGTPVACAASTGRRATITMAVGPGEHWLGVGGKAGSEGNFVLVFHLYPNLPNTGCDSAHPVTFSGTPLTARIASDDSIADEGPSVEVCSESATRQLYWRFEIPPGPPQDLLAHAEATGPFLPLGPLRTLILRRACSSMEQACESDFWGTNDVTLDVPYLAPATYYLILAAGYGSGPFTMTLTLTPSTGLAANDTCGPSAETLQFIDGLASTSGSTWNAVDDETPALAPDTVGGDVYYRMSFAAPTDITVTLTYSRPFVPIVSLRSACDAPDLVSRSGGRNQLTLQAQRVSGDLYLVVDSAAWDQAGTFTLNVEATPPP